MRQQIQPGVLLVISGVFTLAAGAVGAQIPAIPDSAVEACLNEGMVGKSVGKIHGVTRPRRLEIECSVDVDSAVFKVVDDHRRGVPAKVGGFREMNFSDCYKYERAAYLLDRELGLNLVPVAIIREVKGAEGALVQWIPNSSHETRMTQQPTGAQLAGLAQQKAIMRLFDALILNVDRRVENWLVDKETWELYLIDHSRAFRGRKKLSAEFTDKRAQLSRTLYASLEELNEERLTQLMGDLISEAQIRSLLARRDLIIDKIDRDCDEWGSAAIFTDWQDPSSPTADIAAKKVE